MLFSPLDLTSRGTLAENTSGPDPVDVPSLWPYHHLASSGPNTQKLSIGLGPSRFFLLLGLGAIGNMAAFAKQVADRRAAGRGVSAKKVPSALAMASYL